MQFFPQLGCHLIANVLTERSDRIAVNVRLEVVKLHEMCGDESRNVAARPAGSARLLSAGKLLVMLGEFLLGQSHICCKSETKAGQNLAFRAARSETAGKSHDFVQRDSGKATRARVRSLVEHVFAAEKRRMGLIVRSIGLVRATAHITLPNLAYNMRRLV